MRHFGKGESCMNDNNSVIQEALRWLRFSDEDLSVASQLINIPTPPRHICWFCQQAVEKALKASLILEQIDFTLTHDLDSLRNLLPEGWPVRYTHDDLGTLTHWAVESRYPGEWSEPTYADAIKAELKARSVCDSIAAEFRKRGMLI